MVRAANRSGFTLIELLTVIGIIILVAALALPSFSGILRGHRWAAATTALQTALLRCQAFAMNERRDHAIEFCVDNQTSRQYLRIETESELLESIPELNSYYIDQCKCFYMRLPQDWVRTFKCGGGVVTNPWGEVPWPPEWEEASPKTRFEYTGPRLNVDAEDPDHPGPRTKDNLMVDDHIRLPYSITLDETMSTYLANYDKRPTSLKDMPQYGWDDSYDLRFNMMGVLVQNKNPEIVLMNGIGERVRLQVMRSTARVRELSGTEEETQEQ